MLGHDEGRPFVAFRSVSESLEEIFKNMQKSVQGGGDSQMVFYLSI